MFPYETPEPLVFREGNTVIARIRRDDTLFQLEEATPTTSRGEKTVRCWYKYAPSTHPRYIGKWLGKFVCGDRNRSSLGNIKTRIQEFLEQGQLSTDKECLELNNLLFDFNFYKIVVGVEAEWIAIMAQAVEVLIAREIARWQKEARARHAELLKRVREQNPLTPEEKKEFNILADWMSSDH